MSIKERAGYRMEIEKVINVGRFFGFVIVFDLVLLFTFLN